MSRRTRRVIAIVITLTGEPELRVGDSLAAPRKIMVTGLS
jgi:hypothetical protein